MPHMVTFDGLNFSGVNRANPNDSPGPSHDTGATGEITQQNSKAIVWPSYQPGADGYMKFGDIKGEFSPSREVDGISNQTAQLRNGIRDVDVGAEMLLPGTANRALGGTAGPGGSTFSTGEDRLNEALVGRLDGFDIRDHVEPLFDPVDVLGVDVNTHFDPMQSLNEFSGDLNRILATVAGSIGESGWVDDLKEWWDGKVEDLNDAIDNLSEGWDRFWDDDNALGTTKSDDDGGVSNSPQGANCKANESDCNSDNDSTDASEDSGTAITAESEGPWGRGPLGPIFFQSSEESLNRNERDVDILSSGGASTSCADALVIQVNDFAGLINPDSMRPVDFIAQANSGMSGKAQDLFSLGSAVGLCSDGVGSEFESLGADTIIKPQTDDLIGISIIGA